MLMTIDPISSARQAMPRPVPNPIAKLSRFLKQTLFVLTQTLILLSSYYYEVFMLTAPPPPPR